MARSNPWGYPPTKPYYRLPTLDERVRRLERKLEHLGEDINRLINRQLSCTPVPAPSESAQDAAVKALLDIVNDKNVSAVNRISAAHVLLGVKS
jgi:hypothetical protein